MAAAPFKATLIFALGSPNSANRISYPCTVSDVNAAYYIFPDGQGQVTLPLVPTYLVDVNLSAAGTDTTTASIYVNAKVIGDRVQNAGNVGTVYQRQFNLAPVGFKPGATIRLQQNT